MGRETLMPIIVPDSEANNEVTEYLAAQRYTRSQVFDEPCPVPKEPGVYGWWFRTVPRGIDVSGCVQRDGLTLLYTGISPGPPPTNGKGPSRENLHRRITYHFGARSANAEGSTLRKTLGILLADELGLELRRVGSGRRRTFAAGEAVLTQWMAEQALVSWLCRPEPWILEDELIDILDVPLNLKGNTSNAFYPQLKRARREAALNAKRLPVLAAYGRNDS
jgi:hypothetical protein